MMKDAYACGADEAVILSDRKFAGSDVLSTSYTLRQGIQVLGGADLIICGRTDHRRRHRSGGSRACGTYAYSSCGVGDRIEEVTEKDISVQQKLGDVTQVSRIPFPLPDHCGEGYVCARVFLPGS